MNRLLFFPMLFYFPRRVWDLVGKEKWEDKVYDNLFDNIIILKSDGSNTLLNNEPSYHHLFIKKERLDKNTFRLLDIQTDLKEEQFKFILSKYCVQLDFCRRVSIWMVENIYQDMKDISKETFQSFELQQTFFEEHWKYIQKSFVDVPVVKKTGNEDVLIEKDLKSFKDLMSPTGLLSGAIKEQTSSSLSKPKKENKIRVTEKEATDFLLKTVFNMK